MNKAKKVRDIRANLMKEYAHLTLEWKQQQHQQLLTSSSSSKGEHDVVFMGNIQDEIQSLPPLFGPSGTTTFTATTSRPPSAGTNNTTSTTFMVTKRADV